MRLIDALELRRRLASQPQKVFVKWSGEEWVHTYRPPDVYVVRRSAKRSLKVSPFYVARTPSK